MAFPYDYNCEHKIDNENGFKGRQSENLLNGEMHKVLESIRHLPDYPSNKDEVPVAEHIGSLWLDQRKNELYNWRGKGYKHPRNRDGWLPVFADKFRITDEILSGGAPENPVYGQLWIYGGVLLYYDGSSWNTIKALEQIDSQFNTSMFNDFTIFSPINRLGSVVFPEDRINDFLKLQKRYQNGSLDLNSDDVDVFIRDTIWNPVDTTSISNNELDSRRLAWKKLMNGYVYDSDEVIRRMEEFINGDLKYQYLVPDIENDRVFIDNKFDTSYTKQNRTVIEYKVNQLIEYKNNEPLIDHIKRPSLIHMNPGKMTNMIKRIFKIDRVNPKIFCPSANTEFYGFKANNPNGELLIPIKSPFETTKDDVYNFLNDQNYGTNTAKPDTEGRLTDPNYIVEGDYEYMSDGIFLSYNAAHNYDYVLAITYEFSWLNATGIVRQATNKSVANSFYVPHRIGDVNIFINGFDYEDGYYTFDHTNQTVTVAEDITRKDKFDVAVLGVFKHEYGFIRSIDMDSSSSAIITAVHNFNRPLIFVNGEVLCKSEWTYYDRNNGIDTTNKTHSFKIPTAKRDMCWTIIEMKQIEEEHNNLGAVTGTITKDICITDDGLVDNTNAYRNSDGNPAIPIPSGINISYEEITKDTGGMYRIGLYRPNVVLFVEGLMIRREDVYYEPTTRTLTCNGLKAGMKYVLLNDPDEVLYTEETKKSILPALSIGKIDQTLVYYDGYLLNEPGSYIYSGEENYAANFALHGEIRAFNDGTNFKIYDCIDREVGVWLPLDNKTGEEIKSFSNSYINTATAISFPESFSTSFDHDIVIYGFKFSNTIDNPISPVNCWLHQNNEGEYFLKEAGYKEEYIELVRKEEDTNVNLDRLDPTDTTSMKDYKQRNLDYYNFLVSRFNEWKSERSSSVSGKTLSQQIKMYKEDSKKSKSEITSYLSGYFYDGVYFKSTSLEKQYREIKELARGKLWANKVFIGKDYNPDKDYVMVWLNGVRQYPDKDVIIVPRYDSGNIMMGYDILFAHYEGADIIRHVDDNGMIDIPKGKGYSVNYTPTKEPLTGILTYIIQRSSGNNKACRYKVLNNENMLNSSQNIYTTKEFKPEYIDPKSYIRDNTNDFSMYPGRVTVYADGVRLPKEAYTIMDNNTLVIEYDEQFFGNDNNYPIFKYINHNNEVKEARRLQPESILVEVREDNEWIEKTLDLKKFDGSIHLFASNSEIPMDILNTQDTILIFIDGLYHGLSINNGYTVNKQKGLISITDYTVLNAIKRDDLETYVKQHPEILTYQYSEMEAYRLRKKRKDRYLTIEWR